MAYVNAKKVSISELFKQQNGLFSNSACSAYRAEKSNEKKVQTAAMDVITHLCAREKESDKDKVLESIRMLTQDRYILTNKKMLAYDLVGDLCTLVTFALSKTEFTSCDSSVLATSIHELFLQCVELSDSEKRESDFRGDHSKVSWVMDALYKLSDSWDLLKFETFPLYKRCVKLITCMTLGMIKGNNSHPWKTYDMAGWFNEGEVTPKFVDSVEPRVWGLANSVEYMLWLTIGKDVTVVVDIPESTSESVVAWLKAYYERMDYDQFATAMSGHYLEHCALPGETFYYNKAKGFVPNWPRETLEFVRPEAFQEILNFGMSDPGALFSLEKHNKNSRSAQERATARCREAALLTAAVSATSMECGVSITNNFCSYSQYECYGRSEVEQRVNYPAAFAVGGFFLLLRKRPSRDDCTVVWCRDVVSCIWWVIAQLAANGNEKAGILCKAWEERRV